MAFRFGFLVLLVCAACLPQSAFAVKVELTQTFTPTNPAHDRFFGSAIALEGGVAVIKSHSGYVDGDGYSVTHVFEEDANGVWTEAPPLEYETFSDSRGNPFIGRELAIDNGEIAISYSDDHNGGRPLLQVATRDDSGWTPQSDEPVQVLRGSVFGIPIYGPAYADFGLSSWGRSVGISDGYAITEDLGAEREDGDIGAARVYQRGDDGVWRESANLVPAGGGDFGAFDVAIDGSTAAVTTRALADTAGLYLFNRDEAGNWSAGQEFEFSLASFPYVAIDEDLLVVNERSTLLFNIYKRSEGLWSLSHSYSSFQDAPELERGFGVSDGIVAYTTARDRDTPATVVLLHQNPAGEWETLATIEDPHPELDLDFGERVAIDQGRILVGTSSPSFDEFGQRVYLFTLVPEPNSLLLVVGTVLPSLGRRRGCRR